MFIDSHAHLTFSDYKEDLEAVIGRAFAAGVAGIVNIGSGEGLAGNYESLELAKKHENIFTTVGFHPHDATKIKSESDPFGEIKKIARHPKVVAVGEIGLDYHYIAKEPDFGGRRRDQIECFEKLLVLSKELHLPVIIHDRDAHKDVIFAVRHGSAAENGGVMHCFSGDTALAKEALDLGFYVSITGAVTFKKKTEILQDVVRFVPIERLLIETDCPFIAPEPHRGKRNEPAFVIEVAKKIAELKKLSLDDVGRITALNARRVFHLPGETLPAKIAYSIRDSLYLNITNRCNLACTFCPKQSGNFEVKGHNLKLAKEPDIEEVFRAIGDPSGFKEVVFCGYGEPTQRLELVKAIAGRLKKSGVKIVRLDTDGLANLVHGRNVLPELAGLIDSVSVSLNAQNAATYEKVCPSKYGKTAFAAMCSFIREAKGHIPQVVASVVSCPGVDVGAARRFAEEELKVSFRVREYQEVG